MCPLLPMAVFAPVATFAEGIACGADGVMMGQPIAGTHEAPGKGYRWGMAASSVGLPRGTRIKVGQIATLQQILHDPATRGRRHHELRGRAQTRDG